MLVTAPSMAALAPPHQGSIKILSAASIVLPATQGFESVDGRLVNQSTIESTSSSMFVKSNPG